MQTSPESIFMKTIYLDIHIAVPPDEHLRGIIPAALSDYPFEGFAEDDRGLHCYIKKNDWHESIDSVLKNISEQFQLMYIDHISTSEIEQRNWNEDWEQSLQPIHVSEKLIVTPSWHTVDDAGKTVIVIDPKMTFGTGYHETTRLTMRLMEQYIQPDSIVLDVGTGTGVLAIAAVKLGARHAVGIDIDEWSKSNGEENAARNNVQEAVEIRIGSMETVAESSFDLIVANIIRNTILELLDSMLVKLSSAGKILLSGLLVSDREIIEQALRGRGCSVLTVIQENDWIAIAAART